MSGVSTGPVAHGAKSIGTSAAALSTSTVPLVAGLTVKSITGNGGVVYVGITGVTTSTGYPLAAGESVPVGATNPAEVFVIGSAGTQDVRWIGN